MLNETRLARIFPFLALSLLPVLIPMGWTGCLFSQNGNEPGAAVGAEGRAEAKLVLRTSALAGGTGADAAVDSVHIAVTGEGMEPRYFEFKGDSINLNLTGLPAGDNRLVKASLFQKGRLMYLGQAALSLRNDAPAELTVRCEPQFSRVTANIHLPAALPYRIANGTLTLTASTESGAGANYQAPMVRKGEFADFTLEAVAGNVKYDVVLALEDSSGKVAYRAERKAMLLSIGVEAQWDLPLTATAGSAGVALILPTPKVARIMATFPSRKRPPAAAGEALVTEFYAAPADKDSGSEGEWWEIFNRSQDTLALKGCRLARDRGIGVTKSYAFDSLLVLLPGQAKVFGRYASGAEVKYHDFSLVNTAQSLLLLCNGDALLVDSLRYSSSVEDSLALPMKEGMVTEMDADKLSDRASRKAWCLAKSEKPSLPDLSQPFGQPGLASPGYLGECLE